MQESRPVPGQVPLQTTPAFVTFDEFSLTNSRVSLVANAGNATCEKHSAHFLLPGRCFARASVNASHPSISSFTSVVVPSFVAMAMQMQSTVSQSRLNAVTRSMSDQ